MAINRGTKGVLKAEEGGLSNNNDVDKTENEEVKTRADPMKRRLR